MPELKTLKDGEVQILPKTKTEAIIFETPIEEISKESREIKEELNTINGEPIADIGQGLSKLVDTKKNLMIAIQSNGVQMDKATPFNQYAEKISQITAGEPEIKYSITLQKQDAVGQIKPDFPAVILQYNYKDLVTINGNKYDFSVEPTQSQNYWIINGATNITGTDTSIISFNMPANNVQILMHEEIGSSIS